MSVLTVVWYASCFLAGILIGKLFDRRGNRPRELDVRPRRGCTYRDPAEDSSTGAPDAIFLSELPVWRGVCLACGAGTMQPEFCVSTACVTIDKKRIQAGHIHSECRLCRCDQVFRSNQGKTK